MLILGAQILLGFHYRAVFESGFDHLPQSSRYATLVGLTALIMVTVLIMWPGAYHRIAREGANESDVHGFTTAVMGVVLFPFLVALGIDAYIMSAIVIGPNAGLAIGMMTGAVALVCWFGLGIVSRNAGWDQKMQTPSTGSHNSVDKTSISDKVEHVLIEARVVLPGAQALLGFQLATMLMESFDKLPYSSKMVHLVSLLFTSLSVILLMTPTAYHRIVERGEATEHFHRVASMLMLAAMIALPLGICGDFFVVIQKVLGSTTTAVLLSATALSIFYGLWFGVTGILKTRLHSSQRPSNQRAHASPKAGSRR